MAQSVIVKNKEIRVKNPQMVIEDENRAEIIEFTITNANAIEGVLDMAFYVQYRNKLGEVGMDIVYNAYPSDIIHNDMLVLDWLPSATFSKERGKVDIQLIGFTSSFEPTEDTTYQSGKLYFSDAQGTFLPVYPADSTHSPKVGDEITGTVYENVVTGADHRWSTEKCTLTLPENIYDNGTPIYTEEQVMSLITQLNAQVLLAQEAAESAEDSAELAEAWATQEDEPVEGDLYSAKYYAEQASGATEDIREYVSDAKDWAIGERDDQQQPKHSEESSKHWAGEAKDEADRAAALFEYIVRHDEDLPGSAVPINADQLNGHPDNYFAVKVDSANFIELVANQAASTITAVLKNTNGTEISSSVISVPAVRTITETKATKRTAATIGRTMLVIISNL